MENPGHLFIYRHPYTAEKEKLPETMLMFTLVIRRLIFVLVFCFASVAAACRILVPQRGIEPVPPLPPAAEAWSLNHQTPRQAPESFL